MSYQNNTNKILTDVVHNFLVDLFNAQIFMSLWCLKLLDVKGFR